MSDGTRILTVPRHNPVNAIKMGGIVRDAGMSVDEFKKLFKCRAPSNNGTQRARTRVILLSCTARGWCPALPFLRQFLTYPKPRH